MALKTLNMCMQKELQKELQKMTRRNLQSKILFRNRALQIRHLQKPHFECSGQKKFHQKCFYTLNRYPWLNKGVFMTNQSNLLSSGFAKRDIWNFPFPKCPISKWIRLPILFCIRVSRTIILSSQTKRFILTTTFPHYLG